MHVLLSAPLFEDTYLLAIVEKKEDILPLVIQKLESLNLTSMDDHGKLILISKELASGKGKSFTVLETANELSDGQFTEEPFNYLCRSEDFRVQSFEVEAGKIVDLGYEHLFEEAEFEEGYVVEEWRDPTVYITSSNAEGLVPV